MTAQQQRQQQQRKRQQKSAAKSVVLQESRRIEFVLEVLKAAEVQFETDDDVSLDQQVKVSVSERGLQLKLSQDLASTCYQQAVSASEKRPIRTLTHIFPRNTADPLLQSFSHKLTQESKPESKPATITQTIKLPVDILTSAIQLERIEGTRVFVQRLIGLLTDLQPVSDPRLLFGRCRKNIDYNTAMLVEAARRHAFQWGFDETSLVQAYIARDPTFVEPPIPIVPYDDLPVTWEQFFSQHPAPSDIGDDDDQQQPQFLQALPQRADRLEHYPADDLWPESAPDATRNSLAFVETLEHLTFPTDDTGVWC